VIGASLCPDSIAHAFVGEAGLCRAGKLFALRGGVTRRFSILLTFGHERGQSSTGELLGGGAVFAGIGYRWADCQQDEK
jgi:hypothetical protein